jgi:hypothetical protein
MAVANKPRTAMICPGGRVAEASFKRLSFAMKKAIARSIATMPRRLFLGGMRREASWRTRLRPGARFVEASRRGVPVR